MYIPLVSPLSQRLYPRKGGGGGHGGGDGGGHSSSSGGKSSSSSSKSGGSGSKSDGDSGSSSSGSKGSSGRSQTVPLSGSTGGKKSATSYSGGGGKPAPIPSGQPFAGRISGGATRSQVYGTSHYGSGYPGLPSGTVAGRGFPFVFWPVVWGGGLGYGAGYLHDHEYGLPDNTSRPGGSLAQATFNSNSSNSTFYVISDNSTVASLIGSISSNCTLGNSSSKSPSPFNGTASQPRPEQVIQYYRASSVALALDGYNDTAILVNPNATAVPLPGWVDTTLLNCLNYTIGEAVPLVSGADLRWQAPSAGLLGLVWVVWCLSSLL